MCSWPSHSKGAPSSFYKKKKKKKGNQINDVACFVKHFEQSVDWESIYDVCRFTREKREKERTWYEFGVMICVRNRELIEILMSFYHPSSCVRGRDPILAFDGM